MMIKFWPAKGANRPWSLQRRLRWMTLGALCNALIISGVLAYYGLTPLLDSLQLVRVLPSMSRVEQLQAAVAEQRDLLEFHELDEHGLFSDRRRMGEGRLNLAIERVQEGIADVPPALLPQAMNSIRQAVERLANAQDRRATGQYSQVLLQTEEQLQDWFWQVNYSYVLPAVDQGKVKYLMANEARALSRELRREITTMLLVGELSPARAARLQSLFEQFARVDRLLNVLYRDLAIGLDDVVGVGVQDVIADPSSSEQFSDLQRLREFSPVYSFVGWTRDALVPRVLAAGEAVKLPELMRMEGHASWVSAADFYAAGGQVLEQIDRFMRDVSDVGRHRILLSLIQTVAFYLILALAPLVLMFINVSLARRTGKQVMDAAGQLSDHFEQESRTGEFAPVPKLAGPVELIRIAKAAEVQQDYLDRVSDVLARVGDGDQHADIDPRGPGDVMGCALLRLVTANREIVGQMQRIANGDLSSDLQPRAEQDALVQSVNDMTGHLRELQACVDAERAGLEHANCELEAQGEYLRESNLELEQHRDRLDELVQQRTAALNAVLQQSQEALLEVDRAASVRSEILARVSHELRTPLQAVIVSADLLRSQLAAQQRVDPEAVTVIMDSAQLLNRLIQDMLDFSSYVSGDFEMTNQVFDLHDWLQQLRVRLEREHSSVTDRLSVHVEPLRRRVLGDPSVLGAVVQQYLVNAMQHALDAPIELRVHVAERDDHARIVFVVADDGGQLAPEDTETAFNAFWRGGERNLHSAPGTGLGLNMVRAIAQKMGGNCGAAVDPNRQTLFWFGVRLSLAEPLAVPAGQAANQTATSLRVLVAEDNQVSQMVMLKLLHAMGHQASGAADGQQAVQMAGEQTFDVILMDLDMPHMDGFEATRAIHTADRNADHNATPVVALTANAGTGVRSKCIAAGMVEFLSKPASRQQLAQVLAAIGNGGAASLGAQSAGHQ